MTRGLGAELGAAELSLRKRPRSLLRSDMYTCFVSTARRSDMSSTPCAADDPRAGDGFAAVEASEAFVEVAAVAGAGAPAGEGFGEDMVVAVSSGCGSGRR